jgi:hypothetical protein
MISTFIYYNKPEEMKNQKNHLNGLQKDNVNAEQNVCHLTQLSARQQRPVFLNV